MAAGFVYRRESLSPDTEMATLPDALAKHDVPTANGAHPGWSDTQAITGDAGVFGPLNYHEPWYEGHLAESLNALN